MLHTWLAGDASVEGPVQYSATSLVCRENIQHRNRLDNRLLRLDLETVSWVLEAYFFICLWVIFPNHLYHQSCSNWSLILWAT